jgi:hypothetical protein
VSWVGGESACERDPSLTADGKTVVGDGVSGGPPLSDPGDKAPPAAVPGIYTDGSTDIAW